MPKKSKKKNKHTGKPKNQASSNPEVGSDVSTAQRYDVQYRENPVKSDLDPNEYRVIELPNGLVALLISCPTDPSVETEYAEPDWSEHSDGLPAHQEQHGCPAVCCLCLKAGFFSDPRQVPGVSRILGNVIIDPAILDDPTISSECKKILKQSGSRQLLPLSEATIFYIEVPHRVYREAIGRLGHSLEHAVISKYHTEMSREAVLSLQHSRRMCLTPEREEEHILSQVVSKTHPGKTFAEDYLESLRQVDDDKVYREVQKFRKRHYSADRMTVVMKAELPLDTLETYAKESFSRITNNRLPPELFDSYNFANSVEYNKFRRIWRIYSADCNEIYVKWIVPPSSWLYRTKSLEFLCWLFSRGGEGSLMSYLRMKKWATEVRGRILGDQAWYTSLYSTFCVAVSLTASGNSGNKLDVLDAIYSYINFLRREGPQKSIYDEIRIIRNAEFKYRHAELRCKTDFAELATDMHVFPSTDYFAAPSFWYEYDPVSLSTCLDLMTPSKACIVVTDESFGKRLDNKLACLVRDERSKDIPEDWIDRWQTAKPLPAFKLPGRNIFCPDDLRMADAPGVLRKYPIKVHSDGMSEVWHRFDPKFRGPECRMMFCYLSPLPLESPENAAMQGVFTLVLGHLVRDELYPASLAGLSYTIKSYFLGVGIGASGYTQKLPLLTQALAQSIRKSYHSLTKGLFETKKDELFVLYSMSLRSDSTLAQEISRAVLLPGQWTTVEKLAALPCLQYERFQHFVKHFADRVYIKFLVEGNIAEADAVKDALRVVEASQCGPLPRDMIPRYGIKKMPRGKHCCTVKAFGLNSSNVTVENYYQFDDSSVELGGVLRLLVALSTNSAVQGLRKSDFRTADDFRAAITEICVNNYVLGMGVSSTSTINSKLIASIDAEIEERQQIARDFLKRCIDTTWEYTRDAVVAARRKIANVLSSEFENNWDAIITGGYAFGNVSRQLDALRKMNLADVHKWFKYITDASNIRKLSIRIVGDKYSRTDFSAVKTRPDKSKTGSNHCPLYRLEYLTEHAGQSGNTSYNCITDIYQFKEQLEASSNTNATS